MKSNWFIMALGGVCVVSALIFYNVKIGTSLVFFYPLEVIVYLGLCWMLLSTAGRIQLRGSIVALPKEIKLAIVLIVVGGLVGTVISPLFPTSVGAFKTWIVSPLLLLLLLRSVRGITVAAIRRIIIGYGVVLAAYGLGLFFLLHQERLTSIYTSPNYFGAVVSPILALVLIEWFRTRNRRLIPVILLLGPSLLLTFSIGALLGLALALGAYLYLGLKEKIFSKGIYLFAVLLGVIALLSLARLQPERNSFDSRIQIWRTGGELALLSPVTGIGLRGFEVAYPKYVGRYFTNPIDLDAPQPHNLLLSFWLNTGLAGLVGFVYLLWQILNKRPQTPALFAVIAIFGHGLIDTPYWRVDLIFLFWIYVWLITQENEE